VEVFELCMERPSDSSYIFNLYIHTGKCNLTKNQMDLVLLDKKYHVYEDKCYDSVEVCEILLHHITNVQ
jgi:hypothetical protein